MVVTDINRYERFTAHERITTLEKRVIELERELNQNKVDEVTRLTRLSNDIIMIIQNNYGAAYHIQKLGKTAFRLGGC